MFVLLQLQALLEFLLPLPEQLLHLELLQQQLLLGLLQQQLLPELLLPHQLVLQILPQVRVLNFPLPLQLVPFPLPGCLPLVALLQLQALLEFLLPLPEQLLPLELLQQPQFLPELLLEKSFPPQPVLFQLTAFQYPKHLLPFPAARELHQ